MKNSTFFFGFVAGCAASLAIASSAFSQQHSDSSKEAVAAGEVYTNPLIQADYTATTTLKRLLAENYEIKAAVPAAIFLQKGSAAYMCSAQLGGELGGIGCVGF